MNKDTDEVRSSHTDDLDIEDIEYSTALHNSYAAYAKEVVQVRAIPREEDLLKTVQRRIMWVLLSKDFQRFRKCAQAVGIVSGTLHPHGDQSIYLALVRMSQSFLNNVPLIQGQGNFGSISGDGPAAYRYTECKLSDLGAFVFNMEDMKQDDVFLIPMDTNYDASSQEPRYLNTTIPIQIINGIKGIAVGCTTCIPPHNVSEICNAILYMVKLPDYNTCTYDEIKHHILGPDSPHYCLIDTHNLDQLYRTGQSSIVTTSKLSYNREKNQIIIIGLPWDVKRINLISSIVRGIKEKVLSGIKNIVDLSKEETKIIIELESYANPSTLMMRMLRFTDCSNSSGCVFRVIKNKRQTIVPITQMLKDFIKRRIETIELKYKVKISKLLQKIERMLALFIVFSTQETLNIITKILDSSDDSEARNKLMKMEFDISNIHNLLPLNIQKIDYKKFKLTALQIEYLFKTKVSSFNKSNRENLKHQIKDITNKINDFESLINNKCKIKDIIIHDLETFKLKAKKERVCDLIEVDKKLRREDMEQEKDIIVFLSNKDEISYQLLEDLKIQHKGGKGRVNIEASNIIGSVSTTTHSDIVIITSFGFCYVINMFEIFYNKKTLLQIINLRVGDSIVNISSAYNEEDKKDCAIIVTRMGAIKKHSTKEFKYFNISGKKICNVDEGDSLAKVCFIDTTNDNRVILFSENGKFICLETNNLREFVSRNTKGVKGMKLRDGDMLKEIVSVNHNIESSLLIIDSEANIKRVSTNIFTNRTSHRNTIGSYCVQPKYGKLVACIVMDTNRRSKRLVLVTKNKIMLIHLTELEEKRRLNKGISFASLMKNDKVIFAYIV